MSKMIDLTGGKFGKLTVLHRAENNKYGQAMWLCACDCGKETVVKGNSLRTGCVKSCGCLSAEMSSIRNTKHGLSRRNAKLDRIYSIHSNMLQRCENPKNKSYKNYGGRGIRVCDEWHDVFAFYKWATESGYQPNLTIERIDNDGNYEPNNCRWATIKEQSNNRRNNHFLDFNGETHTISEWSEITDIPREVIDARIGRGWGAEKALTTSAIKSGGSDA